MSTVPSRLPRLVGVPVRAASTPVRRFDPMRTPWRWSLLWAAPHRLAFMAGMTLVLASALWWGAVLLLRAQGVALPWAVSPGLAHAWVMGFGFMPLFMAGFLFTAGPRWLGLPEMSASALTVPLGAMVGGWALALVGFHAFVALAAVGLALVAAGWAIVVGRFALLVLQSRAADKLHATGVTLASLLGAVVLWAAAVALVLQREDVARAALQVGLWGVLAMVFAFVSHRMIPFFSAAALPSLEAWRPNAVLWLLVALVGSQAPLAAADALGVAWSAPALLLRAAAEAAGGAFLLWLAVRWGLVQSLRIRLLAMLHLGFVWLGVAFLLGALGHAAQALQGDPSTSMGAPAYALAATHALTIGYLASTLVAMVTRVSVGHGGRTLVADDWAWVLFWAVQAAALARVGAALWPAMATPLTLLAVQAWLAGMGAWAVRHARWYGRVRADGRPG